MGAAQPPFAGYQPGRIVSIFTGVVADTSFDCDNAVQIGQAAASKLTGKQFTKITLHRSDKVKNMGNKNNINVREQNIVVNPTLFFNRITYVLKTNSDMEQFMSYELAPQPPTLFHDGVMRKPANSILCTLFKSFVPVQANIPNNCQFVIDGGHLLQAAFLANNHNKKRLIEMLSGLLKHAGIQVRQA